MPVATDEKNAKAAGAQAETSINRDRRRSISAFAL